MSHQRSVKCYADRLSKYQQRILANKIVLDFTLFCKDNHDKVWHLETEEAVKDKLKEAFGEGIPHHALNHDYGEVLNRFG